MASIVLLLAGLPGSGKTHYLKELEKSGWHIIDDFKAGAKENSPRFCMSQHFERLRAYLSDGKSCAVADIDFCVTESRKEAECVLGKLPEAKIEWLYFEHDEHACEENIRSRDRESLPQDLEALRRYSRAYAIPNGANVTPVWQRKF